MFFRKTLCFSPLLAVLLAFAPSGCVHLGNTHQEVICKENPMDPFEPDARMPGGPFRGKCINTTKRRSVKILSEQEAMAYNLDPGCVSVANFSHAKTFWIASIPKDLKIIGVNFVRSWFFFGVAHLSIHFLLDESTPVVLVPQMKPRQADPVTTIDVVFSLEGLESRSDPLPFTPGGALFGKYVAVYRFLSLDALRDEKSEGLDPLWVNLPPKSRERFFWKLVEESDRTGLSAMFRIFERNCGNTPINALDSVMEYDAKTRSRIAGKNCYNPLRIKSYLKERGIDAWSEQ